MPDYENYLYQAEVLSHEKHLAEEARDQALLETNKARAAMGQAADTEEESYRKAGVSDCARQDAVSAMRNAERAKNRTFSIYRLFRNQLRTALAEYSVAENDANQIIEEIERSYKDAVEELSASKKAQQDASKRQEHEEASQLANIERLQTDFKAATDVCEHAARKKEQAESSRKDDISRLQAQQLESRNAQQATTVELDRAINREKQDLAGKARAEETKVQACYSKERSYIAKLHTEAELREAQQIKPECARKVDEDRAEYGEKLSECIAAKDLALEQKDAAVLEKLSLAKDLAQTRDQVATFREALRRKDRMIAEAEYHGNRMAQRLRGEIMAKKEATHAEDVLRQVLNGNDRKISGLQEQLKMEQSARTNASEENDLLAEKLAEKTETLEALAKREKQMSERERRLIVHLRAMDIDLRDLRGKNERLEDDLQAWRDQDGVIALD